MGKLDCLYQKYKECPSISWERFNSNQREYQKHVVRVKNSDFRHGTLRIRYPCAILFTENIVFNPIGSSENPNTYYIPALSENSHNYGHKGYVLGFFAAIAIETCNVIVDMNGYSIRQGKRFFALQRFYSHIELADQPFLPKQGPADFGKTIDSANNVLIMNGTLSLSSHHGVHGNNNYNIEFRKLKFKEFEVAAIALNAAKNILIHYLCIDGNIQVPLLGNFSAAVFDFIFTQSLLNKIDSSSAAYQDIYPKYKALKSAIDHVASDMASTFRINPERKSTKIFINESLLPDGTTYGILINGKGVAVNSFATKRPKDFDSGNITIKDVTIKNIIGKVHEIVALSGSSSNSNSDTPKYAHGGIQTDHAGSAFQITEVLKNGSYKGNVLSDLQLCLGRWSDSAFVDAHSALVNMRKNGGFGTYSIHPAVISWGWKDDLDYKYNGVHINKDTDFSLLQKTTGIKYIGNGDSMFHVCKGIFGIRLDKVSYVDIKNVQIKKIENHGEPGSQLAGKYSGGKDGGHFAQDAMIGYCGADVYGLLTSACQKIYVDDSCISYIFSSNGSAKGIDINGDSYCMDIWKNIIKCVKSNAPWFHYLPNKIPLTVGISVDKTSDKIILGKNQIHYITNKNFPLLENKYVIDNNGTQIIEPIDKCDKSDNNKCNKNDQCDKCYDDKPCDKPCHKPCEKPCDNKYDKKHNKCIKYYKYEKRKCKCKSCYKKY